MQVAVLNTGSRTVKAALVSVAGTTATVTKRHAVELGSGMNAQAALTAALEGLGPGGTVQAVGHRVVHGGRQFTEPLVIDAAVEEAIEALCRLAPLHNPLALSGIRAAKKRFPGRPMVAVFDTAFHAQRPPESLCYPLPWEVSESLELYRYGFHGIAHASLIESLAEKQGVTPKKITAVTLQLGAGCSGCAVKLGRSIETSMGLSPLGGLPMATRCGDLDPSVVLELLRQGYGSDRVEQMLTHGSGLQGMAGTADMRQVLQAESAGDRRAGLAVALFVRRLTALVGAYFTLLDGAGALVFGGGIGAHAWEIRSRVAAGLSAWGIELEPERNATGASGRISREGSRPVYAFETDEERLIARSVRALLA